MRKILFQTGLDASNFDTKNWNPLGVYIKPGNSVFLLCNFVYHKRNTETEESYFSKVTHPSVIRAICDYCIIALKGKGKILIGNSPLQSADFEKIKESLKLDKIEEFYKSNNSGVTVEFIDLRGYITKLEKSGKLAVLKNDIETVGINVDLSEYSALNEAKGNKRYRITNYSYKWIKKLHTKSRHSYCINKNILGADVILSLPKLKAHEKVGVTLGVKGYVGSVASKESLCHHQFGPPCIGGDEYPDCNPLKILYSCLHDFTYSYNIPLVTTLFQILDRNLSRIFNRVGTKVTAGAWSGNDTAWRMSFDLAKIMHYADKTGNMKDHHIRKNLVLIDGIIGGEGQGPLKPSPVNTNTLIFSDNVADGDFAGSLAMGYDPEKFKIITSFYSDHGNHKIVKMKPAEFIYNGEYLLFDEIRNKFKYSYKPPIGWKIYLD
ncbi:MAG: DUF362 domain-containing protein [Bacteroidota bacterium]